MGGVSVSTYSTYLVLSGVIWCYQKEFIFGYLEPLRAPIGVWLEPGARDHYFRGNLGVKL